MLHRYATGAYLWHAFLLVALIRAQLRKCPVTIKSTRFGVTPSVAHNEQIAAPSARASASHPEHSQYPIPTAKLNKIPHLSTHYTSQKMPSSTFLPLFATILQHPTKNTSKNFVVSKKIPTFALVKNKAARKVATWRDGRVVDCGGLENR